MKETSRKRREGAEGPSGADLFPLVSFDSSAVTLAILAGGEGRRMGGPKGWLRVERDETKGTRAVEGVGGVPVLEWLLERLAWRGPTLLVTAPGRAHPPGWEAFDLEVEDAVPGEGPLRGVLGALEHAPTPAVVVAVVDMPGMTGEALAWLAARLGEPAEERDEMKETRGAEEGAGQGDDSVIQAADPHPVAAAATTLCLPGDSSTRGEGALAVMMRRGGTGGGRIEPFPSAWRREAAQLVRGELAAGRRSLVGLAEGAGRDKVRIIDAPPWPAELWTNLNEPADLKAWEAGR